MMVDLDKVRLEVHEYDLISQCRKGAQTIGPPAQDSLGVCLLQQGSPELVGLLPVLGVDEPTLERGQSVVHQHLHPGVEVPEVEPEYTCKR